MAIGEWETPDSRCRVRSARLEVHQLDAQQVGWHLSAEADGSSERLVVSGLAKPLESGASVLTPTFIDAPTGLVVKSGTLWLTRGSHVRGTISCATRERIFELRLVLDVELHLF
ncbi:MAG: hypothetical protein JNM17_28300 [Archangium sp.]|nr:hypothetical protein [Archangium sp.]